MTQFILFKDVEVLIKESTLKIFNALVVSEDIIFSIGLLNEEKRQNRLFFGRHTTMHDT